MGKKEESGAFRRKAVVHQRPFLSDIRQTVRLAERGGRPAGAVDVSEDGVFVRFRVNDVPIEQLMNVECEEDDFDLVMWELARSGKNWK